MISSIVHGKAVAKSGRDVSLKLITSTPRLNPSTDYQCPQDRCRLLSMSLMTLHLVTSYSFPASSLTQVSTPPLNVKPDRSPRNGLWSLPSRFSACFPLYPEQIPDSPCPFTGMCMNMHTRTHTHKHTKRTYSSVIVKLAPHSLGICLDTLLFSQIHLSSSDWEPLQMLPSHPECMSTRVSTMLYFNWSFIFPNSQLPKSQNYVLLALTSLKLI